MIIFSPITALLQALFRHFFSTGLVLGMILVFVLLAVGVVAIWGVIAVFAWNALLAPYLGASQIVSFGSAVLFLLGVWFLGKIGGCLLGCWSLILFVSGSAAVAVLDMRLDPTHLLVFAAFLYIFGIGSGSSSSSSASQD